MYVCMYVCIYNSWIIAVILASTHHMGKYVYPLAITCGPGKSLTYNTIKKNIRPFLYNTWYVCIYIYVYVFIQTNRPLHDRRARKGFQHYISLFLRKSGSEAQNKRLKGKRCSCVHPLVSWRLYEIRLVVESHYNLGSCLEFYKK